MATNIPVKANSSGDQSTSDVHVYRVSVGNMVVSVMGAAMVFCIGAWLCAGLFVPHLRGKLAHQGVSVTVNLVVAVTFLVFGIFWMIRTFQWHVTITNAQVEVDNGFRSHTIPFTDISGRRFGAGRGTRGIYLYRRGKSRVYVNESMFQLDDHYRRWQASIYDLDKADRLKRKACGKETTMDWFATDNDEQNPAIGGPDAIA
jgi:hypothetical protein